VEGRNTYTIIERVRISRVFPDKGRTTRRHGEAHYAVEVTQGNSEPIRITARSPRCVQALQEAVLVSTSSDTQVDHLNIGIYPIDQVAGILYPIVVGITLVMKDGTQEELLPLPGKPLGHTLCSIVRHSPNSHHKDA
jgi:hypothetical protein